MVKRMKTGLLVVYGNSGLPKLGLHRGVPHEGLGSPIFMQNSICFGDL